MLFSARPRRSPWHQVLCPASQLGSRVKTCSLGLGLVPGNSPVLDTHQNLEHGHSNHYESFYSSPVVGRTATDVARVVALRYLGRGHTVGEHGFGQASSACVCLSFLGPVELD